MSQWITDRRPTAEDGIGFDKLVWVWRESRVHKKFSRAYIAPYSEVDVGTPWAPMLPPGPYKKPSRYVVEEVGYGYWRVRDTKTGVLNNAAFNNEDLAQRLGDFFNEVMP